MASSSAGWAQPTPRSIGARPRLAPSSNDAWPGLAPSMGDVLIDGAADAALDDAHDAALDAATVKNAGVRGREENASAQGARAGSAEVALASVEVVSGVDTGKCGNWRMPRLAGVARFWTPPARKARGAPAAARGEVGRNDGRSGTCEPIGDAPTIPAWAPGPKKKGEPALLAGLLAALKDPLPRLLLASLSYETVAGSAASGGAGRAQAARTDAATEAAREFSRLAAVAKASAAKWRTGHKASTTAAAVGRAAGSGLSIAAHTC